MVRATHPVRFSILHVAEPQEGGVALCVLGLASDQLARGWDVAVATHSSGELGRRASAAGARVLPWNAERGLRHVPREIASLRHELAHEQPDIVHLHSSKAGLVGRTLVRRRFPTVFQPHSWSFDALRGPPRSLAVAWERYGARWADVIVCVSDDEHKRGEQHRIAADWRVIPNGVDVQQLSSTTAARHEARRRLGLGDGPMVACVGRLSRQKGQDILLRAWPRVLERIPAATLLLVGDGPAVHELRQAAGAQVVFAGARDDVPQWLAAADVVAAPSRWEGMSLVMLEAMASGRSLVIGDVSGAREALGQKAGAIVPVEDSDALAAALIERLLDPSASAAEGRNGRKRAEQFYDLRLTTARFAQLYAEVAARPSAVSSSA